MENGANFDFGDMAAKAGVSKAAGMGTPSLITSLPFGGNAKRYLLVLCLPARDVEVARGRPNSAIEAENSRAAAVDNCKNWDFTPSDWLHHAAHNRFARKASARQQFG
jgi:hypothetical protein